VEVPVERVVYRDREVPVEVPIEVPVGFSTLETGRDTGAPAAGWPGTSTGGPTDPPPGAPG